MIRETLTGGSRHAMAFTTPTGAGNGFGMVFRPTTNAATTYADGPALNAAPNNWVRLVRTGASISAYASANGNAWTLMSTTTLSGLPGTVYVGLAVTSSSPSTLATTTFDNVQVVGTQAVVAPSVTLATASSIETGPFTVQAQFSQSVTGVALGDFVLTNGTASNLTGSGTTYSVTITPQAAGTVTISLPANAAQNAAVVGSLASNIVSVTYAPVTNAPFTLQGQDIGTLSVAGSTVLNSTTNVYTVKGSGSDIFGTADGFHYAHTQLTGNGEIRARITSQTNTNPWAKTGVMIREALTAGSRHAIVFTTPAAENNGFGMVARTVANGASSYSGGPAVNTVPNNWVRLVRNGDTLTSYSSANGSAWTLVDSTTLTGLSNAVRIGLAVTSSSPFDLATATFDNVQIVQAAAPAGSIIQKNIIAGTDSTTSTYSESTTVITDADFDADGVNDLIEYALGTENSFDGGWWMTTNAAGRVDAHLDHPHNITDVTFRLESTSDLVTWSAITLAPTTTDVGGGMERLTWSGLTSLGGQSLQRGIVRLRVTQNGGASVVTSPQAWQRHTFNGGSQTVGVSLVNAPFFAGRAGQLLGTSEIALENALDVTFDASTACYLEVLDGALAGHRLEILGLNGGIAALDLASPLSTLRTLPQELSGARVVVRPHVTLAQMFPTSTFQAGAVPEAADQVLFHENGVWHTHWLSAKSGVKQWVSANDASLSPQSTRIIPPGTGVMIKSTGTARASTHTGHVRITPWVMPLASGSNLLSLPWPIDSTPARLGLMLQQGFTASTSPSAADQIQLWKGDTTPGADIYDIYWLLKRGNAGTWVSRSNTTLTDVSSTLSLPSQHAFFLKAQPSTTTAGWHLP